MHKGINLQQAFDMFLLSREEYCSKSTIVNYNNTLRYFINFMVGYRQKKACDIVVSSIERSELQAYTIYLRNRPKYENHSFHSSDVGGVTKRTIRTYQTDVRTFLNYLYDEGFICEPLGHKYKLIRSETRQIVPLSQDDVVAIDRECNDKTERGSRNLSIFHVMLDAGLRLNEVLCLRLQDVDFKQNYIIIVNGKGSKDRIIPLSPRLKKILYTYSVVYRPEVSHSYFFCNLNNGGKLTDNCIKSLFARMKKHTSLVRLYPHLLRHTFATAYMLQGGDLESLRLYMGHSDISTTQKYLHFAMQMKFNDNVYKLDDRMFRKI